MREPSEDAMCAGDDVEITPEMIEAGYDALFDDRHFPEGGRKSTCAALTLAFRAMLRVHRAQSFQPAAPRLVVL